jgi:GNAT superfamily N-acetyltransferase
LTDLDALAALELNHFPEFESMYADAQLANEFLTLSVKFGFSIFVAEVGNQVVGFSQGNPFSMPGNQGLLEEVRVLQLVAVEEEARGVGIGADLIRRFELAARQSGAVAVVSHVCEQAVGVFEKSGWQIAPYGQGFGWVSKTGPIMGDFPDPDVGYPFLASKLLRPTEIFDSFTYPRRDGAPVLDAMRVFTRRLSDGIVRRDQLNPIAIQQLSIAARVSPFETRGTFGQKS